jgi:PAS domain S-box-containing protein
LFDVTTAPAPTAETLTRLCRVAARLAGAAAAVILSPGARAPAARWGEPPWGSAPELLEPLVNAVAGGDHVVGDTTLLPRGSALRACGIGAYVAVPLRGAPRGTVIAVVSGTPREWGEELLGDLDAVATIADGDLGRLLENTPDIVARFDLDLRHRYVNGAVERLTGFPPEAFLGRTHEEFALEHAVPPSFYELWSAALTRVREAGSPEEILFEFPATAGPKVFRCHLTPERDTRGAIVSLLSVGRDVTSLHRAEAALRESEARFRLLVEGSGQVFFYTHDRDGRFTYLSPSVQEVMGYRAEEMLGRRYHDFVLGSDVDHEEVRTRTERSFESNVHGQVYTTLVRHRDGRTIALELVEGPVAGHGGVADRVQGFARDVTHRREAELALRLQSGYLEQLFEGAPEGIVLLDNDSRIIRGNREFLEMFGLAEENVTGLAIDDVIARGVRAEEAQDITRRVREGETVGLDTIRWRRDGTPFHVSVLGNPIVVDGAQVGVYGIYRDITGRKTAEAALRESEAQFRAVVESLGEGLLLTDLEGTVLYVNDRFSAITGYAREELIGRVAYTTLLREDQWEASRKRTAERATGVSAVYEVELTRKDGSRVWVQNHAAAMRDAAGAVVGTVGAMTDVTERRQAEAALRESEELFRSLIENSSDVIDILEADGRIRYVTPSLERVLGYRPEEVVGTPVFEVVHPRDVPRVRALLEDRVRDPGGVASVEARLRHRDGSWRVFEAVVRNLLDNPAVRGLVVNSRDVTDRKTAETQLAAAEAHYRRLVEASPYGIYVVDHEFRIREMNPALEVILGRMPDDVLGHSYLEFLAPEDVGAAELLMRPAAPGGGASSEVQMRVVRPSGERRLIQVRSTPVVEDGRLVGAHGVIRDVTEERTREEQFRRAERLASLGTLVSGVAHELNNPLTSIKSFAELLLLDARPSEDREALDIIRREAERASKIVSDLRIVSRRSDPGKGRFAAVELDEVVKHVLRIRRYTLDTHNVEVEEDLSGTVTVWADRVQLEQVLLNLIVNAEQAMARHSGYRRLGIRTRVAGGSVRLQVSDTGPGILPEHLERIFDPFFTTKEPGEGTGLGLSLVHSIVSEHGGEIRVESVPGHGTCFSVLLPAAGRGLPRAEPTVEPSGSRRPLRILVVDDEEPIRRSLLRYLSRRGHHVAEASDGAEALRRLAAAGPDRTYDVILADLRMPGLGGDQLLERLKQQRSGLERKLIFMTGDAASPDAQRILSTAGVPVVLKPFELAEVAQIVEWHTEGDA